MLTALWLNETTVGCGFLEKSCSYEKFNLEKPMRDLLEAHRKISKTSSRTRRGISKVLPLVGPVQRCGTTHMSPYRTIDVNPLTPW